MIKSIELQNFLSHKKSKMIFGKGVNAIVGATDSGKSAIIQAFRWVAFNRPSGDGMRSNWGGETKVTIAIDGGRSIIRIKSVTENKYILYSKHNGTKLVFNGFGTTVPIEIKNALNITETNLQTQDAPYFLLSSSTTAGDVAIHFNSMAHLNKIDIGRKNITSWIRGIESSINADESELKRLKGELKAYSDINIIEEELISIETVNAQLTSTIESIINIENYISELVEIEENIKKQSSILPAEKLVNQVIFYQSSIAKKEKVKDTLKELVSNLRFINFEINTAENFIKAEPLVNALIKDEKELQKKFDNHTELENIKHYLSMITSKEKSNISELKIMQKTFDDNMGETCILCGFKLKKKKL